VGSFTETTAHSPSRASSPLGLSFRSFQSVFLAAYVLMVLVSAPLKTIRWAPPSRLLMLFE
jgi:hypothetical protein